MKRLCLLNVITTLILFSISGVYGQSSGKINQDLGVGFNMGGHRVYGDSYTESGTGLGFEGLVNYTFRQKKFGVITSLGFGWIKGKDIENDTTAFDISLLTLDVKAAFWPLLGNPFNPYAFIGLGAFNFSYPHDNTRRFFDGSFILGAAVEYMVTPKVGLNATLDYRYTTGDDLDLQNGGVTDGYLNGRVGLTFYFKKRGSSTTPDDKILAELPMEDFNEPEEDESSHSNEQVDEIKSNIDNLNEQVNGKESEIQELKIMLEGRKEKIEQMEKGVGKKPPVSREFTNIDSNDGYAANYETGLQSFYAHDFDAAINIFRSLLQMDSNHRLANNCQYWIGESYYGKKDYGNAIEAFGKVLDFNNSHKADDALLMIGLSYMRIGKNTMARESFERIISVFPDSEYREKAENYLSVLE